MVAPESSQKLWMIVPCYNEAQRFAFEYWALLVKIPNSYWLFVDDGSTDETKKWLTQFIETNQAENASVLSNLQNQGKGESVRGAIQHLVHFGLVDNHIVGFIDADGAVPAEEVMQFIDRSRKLLSNDRGPAIDAVWSSRVALAGRKIRRQQSRFYFGRIIHTVIGTRYPTIPYDTQCGLKLFKVSDALLGELEAPFRTRWFFEIEMILRRRRNGDLFRIREEPLEEWNEIGGSHISGKEIFRVFFEMLKLVSVRWI